MFQNGISRNTKCDIMVCFPKSSHICMFEVAIITFTTTFPSPRAHLHFGINLFTYYIIMNSGNRAGILDTAVLAACPAIKNSENI